MWLLSTQVRMHTRVGQSMPPLSVSGLWAILQARNGLFVTVYHILSYLFLF